VWFCTLVEVPIIRDESKYKKPIRFKISAQYIRAQALEIILNAKNILNAKTLWLACDG
jgi:hypothetical protein